MKDTNKIKVNTFYDKKTKIILGVELPDKTIVMVDKKNKGLRIAFPRRKFWNIFKKQNEEKRKYLEIMFSEKELEIIYQMIGKKKKDEKKHKRNKRKNNRSIRG